MESSFTKQALVLGLLSAIGPFAVDMYLPAVPALGQGLKATPLAVQQSLMAFFLAIGIGQLLYGPLSDMFGRKRPLYAGLTLFALTSVACAFVTSIESLTVWRFVQGIGASAVMVIPRAVVRDLHSGTAAARLMSLMVLAFSVSPLLAPLGGSLAIAWASWRAVFWLAAALALFGLLLTATGLPETRPRAQRVSGKLRRVFAGYGTLLRDERFLGLCLVSGFGMSGFLLYLASSSLVLITHYGLTHTLYSLFFSLHVVAFLGSALLVGPLTAKYGLPRVLRAAASGHALTMVSLCLLWNVGFTSLPLFATLLFVGFGLLGLVIPTSTVLLLDDHAALAGTAAALLGSLQMVTGAVVVALLSAWADGTPTPMVVGVSSSACITAALTWWTLRQPRVLESASVELEA